MKRIRFRKKQNLKQQAKDIYPVNEKIRAPELRVIDENGEMLGVLKTSQALSMAKERDLDLVEVSPKARPPVAKFLNYGNFKYQQEKLAKKQKTQQKKSDDKSLRLSARIGQHDLKIRQKQTAKFLERGDKVNLEILLKGRERQHPEIAKQMLTDFIAQIDKEITPVKIEQEPKKQGAKIIAIILPGEKLPADKDNNDKEQAKPPKTADTLDE